MIVYHRREGETLQGKEGTKMKNTMNYTETTMEAMIEEALAEMEKNGETLPEIRYGEEG